MCAITTQFPRFDIRVDPRLITPTQAAAILGVPMRTVEKWLHRRQVPSVTLRSRSGRRKYRLPLQGLLTWAGHHREAVDDLDLGDDLDLVSSAVKRVRVDDVLERICEPPR